jgi:hypothetical protein
VSEGPEALGAYLDDHRAEVRVAAAGWLPPFETDAAVSVLRAGEEDQTVGLPGVNAKWCLRAWREGRWNLALDGPPPRRKG